MDPDHPTSPDRGLFLTHPCQCVKRHSPPSVETEAHHITPQWLQQRVWGALRDPATVPLCPTAHMNCHAYINAVLHGQPPPPVNAYTRHLAEQALAFARQYNVQPPYPPVIVPVG